MLRLSLLFFLSGAAGLTYEVVWTRVLGDVVGSTAVSSSAVFSVFLAGLALGAAWFGRSSRTEQAALRLYGRLELGVAAVAGGTSAIMLVARPGLAALGPHAPGVGLELAFAVGISALLVAPPAFLMGATLPVLVQAAGSGEHARSAVPTLYGWNTVGAGVGTLLTGFVLVWRFGFVGTVALAVGVNLAVAGIALGWARSWQAPSGLGATEEASDPSVGRQDHSETGDREPDRLWTALAFFSGLQVLALEVLWGRVSRFVLGDRTMALSALLFVFVVCLGAASLLTPVLARRFAGTERRSVVAALGGVLVVGSILNLLAIPFGASVATAELAVAASRGIGARLLTVLSVLGPPIVVLGFVFPGLVWGAREVTRRPGRVVGRLYLINTVGAVLGAWAAAFLIADGLGTVGGLRLMTALGLVVGLVLVWHAARGGARTSSLVVAGVALLAVPFVPADLTTVLSDETVVERAEDEYGVQVLARTDRGTYRVRNNRLSLIYDLGEPDTDHAQQMAAHWAVLLASGAERVLNVGTGYGITAGAFTLHEQVRRLDTVEILPFLVAHLGTFGSHNFNFVTDPRANVVTGDGRAFLSTADELYDVVSVNVLDPYLPGSAALYTVDFWREARRRLRPGGVYTQLFWGGDLDLLVRGLNEVFPTVLYFPAYGGTSYNVVAFRDEVVEGALATDWSSLSAPARAEIERLEGGELERRIPALLAEGWELRTRMNELARAYEGPLHTDAHPVLEYRWANGVPGVSSFDSPLVVN